MAPTSRGCSSSRALREGWKAAFALLLVYSAFSIYETETQPGRALHFLDAEEQAALERHKDGQGFRQLASDHFVPRPVERPGRPAAEAAPAEAAVDREEAPRPQQPLLARAREEPPKPREWPEWRYCAKQWDHCKCRGHIRWGNAGTWHMVHKPEGKKEDHTTRCSVDKLPDVLPGDGEKHCECFWTPGDPSLGAAPPGFGPDPVVEVALASPEIREGSEWVYCAGEWQECVCLGHIRWGNSKRDKWLYVLLKPPKQEQMLSCSIRLLQDVAPGDSKHCECLLDSTSPSYQRINPGLLPEAAAARSEKYLVASCDKFQAGARECDAGATQWEAVQGICTDPPGQDGDPPQVGDKPMTTAAMRSLMRAWVEPRFAENYRRLYNKSGWIPRAFVNYYAGRSGGKHALMTEELVKSVHMFSQEVIVVVHFGFTTVETWDPERFNRLVLLNAPPMPSTAGRSFNFNKLRAMLLSRAVVGVQLDSDQFVVPGVDKIFKATAREITRAYPMPIMPSHFLDWGPVDQGPGGIGAKLWGRFCPDGGRANCRGQTARWGHAHPTWTFWAAPFLGRWLGRNFRDEWLPRREDRDLNPLRVTDIGEDEDLLNVATWEEGGTKTWCKFDLPDPTEADTWLFNQSREFNLPPSSTEKRGQVCTKGLCGNIEGDPRFHPKGVAKAFYTVHHAVNPDVTKKYLERLQAAKDMPLPILFDRTFYADGQELLSDNPEVRCII